ncbi:MAG: BamA/TamA family outer membrane protein [Bacteroidia bacterium]
MKRILTPILLATLFVLAGCETTKPFYAKQERDWQNRTLPDKELSHTVWLVGDAGESSRQPLDSALALLRAQVDKSNENSAVVFLGDNIYPAGLPPKGDSTRAQAESHLMAQLDAIKGLKGRPFFIPGNHDWNRMKEGGREYVIRQAEFIEEYLDNDAVFFPENGCGDPVAVELSDNLTLIMIDTQWWLQHWDGEPKINKGCEIKSRAELEAKLAYLIDEYDDTNMILAMHHPMFTQGSHNGYFPLTEHVFPLTYLNESLYIPLPVIGSLHPINRFLGTSRQDVTNALNKRLMDVIDRVTFRKDNMVIASGHEHNLQYFNVDEKHFIVSGAGSKKSYLKRGLDANFLFERQGFVKLNYYKNGEVWMEYWVAINKKGQGNLVFRKQLSGVDLQGDAEPETTFQETWVDKPDSIGYMAAPNYDAGKGKRFWLGRNYRDAWTDPVKLPVLDMDTTLGGLVILKKGGGQQSTTFRLRSKRNGKQYVLRSIYKDATPTLPDFAKNTAIDSVFQDQMSMDHPYGASVVAQLAEGAGVFHANPKFFYVPKQPRLGDFMDYGDQAYLFEERPAGNREDVDGFGNSEKIISFRSMLEKTTDDPDDIIDGKSVLRARLFDMLVGDWDRHDDQWRWARFEEDGKKVYRPIPRDRDHAFLSFRGVLPWIASRPWAARQLQSFNKKFGDIKGLNFNARHFDRAYLTMLTRDDWRAIAESIKQDLTDKEIEDAVRSWPKELYQLNGEELIAKLKSRRDQLVDAAMEHYSFIAKEVEVRGSNEPDLFEAEYLANGNLQVKVFDINSKGTKKVLFYDRIFLPKETKEVRLYGLENDDKFIVKGDKQRKVRLRIIGGPGKDIFNSDNLEGTQNRVEIYDNTVEKNTITEGSTVDDCHCEDDDTNIYNRLSFKYNNTLPIIVAKINPDDGLFLGLGYDRTAHGWGHDPFKTKEKISANFAFATGAMALNYDVLWNNAIGNWDFGGEIYYATPSFVTNYFGRGNNTTNPNTDRANFNFNRLRYSQLYVKPRLVQQFGGGDQFFTITGGYTYTEAQRTEDRITAPGNDNISGLMDSDFEAKHYASLSLKYNVDRADANLFPKRGIRFSAETGINQGLQTGGNRFAYAQTELTFYYTPLSPFPLTFAFRGGWAGNFGDTEFFQSQFLGRRNGLRGFRAERFAGDKVAYLNSEARLKLGVIRGILPNVEVGLIGAYDQGRVWLKNENFNNWHRSFGGGLWIAPYEVIYISGTLTKGIIQGVEESTFADFRLGFWF